MTDFVDTIIKFLNTSVAILACGVFILVYFLGSMGTLDHGFVAVRTNKVTGSVEVITEQGLVVDMPLVHRVQELSLSPLEFKMFGEKDEGPLHSKQLCIRCEDGANICFPEFTLVAVLIPSKADIALRHAWGEEGFLTWLKPHIRSILRDEFGRENTLTMSNANAYQGASARAKDMLNQKLEQHGIQITDIITPRPQFDKKYEDAIQERISTKKQMDVIASDLETAVSKRKSDLATLDQKQNATYQQKRTQFESDLAGAISFQAETQQQADQFRIEKIANGQASLSAAREAAKQLKGQLWALLGTKKAQIEAFRTQPIERVMQAISDQLAGVTVRILPYAHDATPTTLKMENFK